MYIIMAYKPSSNDYCRGCHMASYSSDFKYIATENRREAIDFAIGITVENEFMDVSEAGYDLTFLKNGKELWALEWDDPDRTFEEEISRAAQPLIEARKTKEQAEAKAKADAYNAGIVEQERKKYLELKKKFGE